MPGQFVDTSLEPEIIDYDTRLGCAQKHQDPDLCLDKLFRFPLLTTNCPCSILRKCQLNWIANCWLPITFRKDLHERDKWLQL